MAPRPYGGNGCGDEHDRAPRRRVQQAVDRRFNRRRYDAAQTVEAFAVRLRDQVDLDALNAEVLGVVAQTMQPTRASLWLRQPAPSAARQRRD